ncbi:hypothetical protein RvY_07712 [Ramazzottius varieornatus]|uniref:NADP-dependent oxidoreductase domain-containing protein n=1 Tax=Ramazzottius varieornatus TaxID=947166 RepID=A0A1D1V3F8_RAMVA|nr:hypothetical protein RvY_07712 [Ramazzottius varieornatus]
MDVSKARYLYPLCSVVAVTLIGASSVDTTTDLRFKQPVLSSTNMSLTGHFVTTSAGVQMPRFIYGTAWKKDRTTDLIMKAVLAGFRGIDTANQEKHYREDLVGAALGQLQQNHGIRREDLFIQTKFTSVDGQDPRTIPYDPKAPLQEQVHQSFAKSLTHLNTSYVDSLVMHGPMRTHEDTMVVWKVFEEFHSQGKAKQLGMSNVYELKKFERIYKDAQVKPSVLQNRFHADTAYDTELRAFCKAHNVIYQSFWTLTANPHILKSQVVRDMAAKYNKTTEQIFFRFVMDLGIVPLTGTTNEQHMRQDLEVLDMQPLTENEMAHIEQLMIREFSAHRL